MAGGRAATPTDWNAVLERLLEGDRLAFLEFNRLVSGFLAQLRAYDFRDEWDDLRQEVLMAVVANARAGRLRDPDALVGYVRILTRNKYIDRLKKRIRHQEKQALPWDEESAHAFTPVARVAPADLRDLRTALGELSSEQQRILEGIYRDGRTYQEVSDATGIPLGTLKRRLRESIGLLRQRLRPRVEDG